MGRARFKLYPVDYEEMLRTLKERIKYARTRKNKVCLQILLIQLVNGAKISDAYRAYYEWLKDPSRRTVSVKVSKYKKPVYRVLTIPVDVIEPINEKVHIVSVKKLAIRSLGINTHSLRLAYIYYLARKLYLSPEAIAKIIKHYNPREIAGIITVLDKLHQEKQSGGRQFN